jgi:signal transduction histidine kinase
MRLADYIEDNAERIVDAAEAFATTQMPRGLHLDREALRDHLPQILAAVVADLRQAQAPADELAKAEGTRDTPPGTPSAAQLHGRLRAKAGFNIDQLVAEYRALRASVLRAWAGRQSATAESFEDMIRFNQAIDQAVAESVAHFAAEAESWRQVFLGVLGHDLRGPLSAIMLTSELMSKMARDTPLSKQAERLIASGKRMNDLLNDLLDHSRTSLGMGIRITRGDASLADELADELDLLRAAWPGSSIEWTAPDAIEGSFDTSRLREALANLVNNAVKYGIARGAIRVALQDDGDDVLLSVHNSGSTIPAGVLKTMFDPLSRGPARANEEEEASLGLGLFVVQQVAKAHGGNVTVESAGEGTTFTMRLARRESRWDASAQPG